mmetsp:Transcript_128926/g.412138  ORF Transcript_128926/g.412138 Transcript_128926/m.412138 type:complete len:81 (+) Transcript_128926:1049-1291(+)
MRMEIGGQALPRLSTRLRVNFFALPGMTLSSSKSSSTRMDVRQLESRLLIQKPLRCMKHLETFQGTQWLFAQLLASWVPV